MQIYTLVGQNGDTILYDITTDKSRNLLFSGHKACLPLLGDYISPDSSIVACLMHHTLPCNIQEFLNVYVEQIEDAFEDKDTTQYHRREWNKLLGNKRQECLVMRDGVDSMLTTHWGQSISNTDDSGIIAYAYNYLIPSVDTCNHALVGCVAVAMGQVLKYWNMPLISYNRIHQFDWCRMPDKLLKSSPTFDEERYAVAELLADCASSVDMNYGCPGTGSSASMSAAREALVNGYYYSSDADRKLKMFYSDSDWKEMLKDNLDEGYPVIYAANRYESLFEWPGHAFVCDGYHGDYFHFNWGYRDKFFGLYTIDNLRLSDGRFFKYNHEAIFNIHPSMPLDVCDFTVPLEVFYNGFYTTHINNYDETLPYYFLIPKPQKITPTTATTLVSSSILNRSEYRTITNNDTAEYRAHEEIHLRDGFTVERGAEFTAQIVPCANCENNRGVEDQSIVETGNEKEESVPDMAAGRPSIATEGLREETVLYPNPTDGELTIGVAGEVQSIVIYNAMGRPVGGWNLRRITEGQVSLDLNPLPAGTYIVRIQTADNITARRIIVAR